MYIKCLDKLFYVCHTYIVYYVCMEKRRFCKRSKSSSQNKAPFQIMLAILGTNTCIKRIMGILFHEIIAGICHMLGPRSALVHRYTVGSQSVRIPDNSITDNITRKYSNLTITLLTPPNPGEILSSFWNHMVI
jgi:hypothetical protein